MISIIICSINDALFKQVVESIEHSIQVPFEIIRMDNKANQFGICKAYNDGAAKANFPYLCFLHEDILIKSSNWGAGIINFFEQNPNVGIVGVAGATYKSLVPSVWAQGLHGTDHANLIQHYRKTIAMHTESVSEAFSEVKTLDGVFLFTKKEVWEKHPFDEVTFDKFHCYDLDFCLQVGQHHQIFVYNHLLIEHFSSGSLNVDWVNYSIKLADKWQALLPVGDLPLSQQRDIEWRNRKIFFFRMNILGFPFSKSFKIFFGYGYQKHFSILKTLGFMKAILLRKLKLSDKPFY